MLRSRRRQRRGGKRLYGGLLVRRPVHGDRNGMRGDQRVHGGRGVLRQRSPRRRRAMRRRQPRRRRLLHAVLPTDRRGVHPDVRRRFRAAPSAAAADESPSRGPNRRRPLRAVEASLSRPARARAGSVGRSRRRGLSAGGGGKRWRRAADAPGRGRVRSRSRSVRRERMLGPLSAQPRHRAMRDAGCGRNAVGARRHPRRAPRGAKHQREGCLWRKDAGAHSTAAHRPRQDLCACR